MSECITDLPSFGVEEGFLLIDHRDGEPMGTQSAGCGLLGRAHGRPIVLGFASRVWLLNQPHGRWAVLSVCSTVPTSLTPPEREPFWRRILTTAL